MKKERKCGDCFHLNACSAWNCGSMYDTKADSCMNYITLEDTAKILKLLGIPKVGEWKEVNDPTEDVFFQKKFYCSECGDWQTYGKTKYCPRCGAKMKGEEDERINFI